MTDTIGKQSEGKLKLSLVPPKLTIEIAKVREYGTVKYKNPDNWRSVPVAEFWDAFLRHVKAVEINGLQAVDEESKLLHLAHMACNLAFLIELGGEGE